ncbi:MAG TPA: type IV pilus modification protein PilV [Steroidobacteraceae bacterium]
MFKHPTQHDSPRARGFTLVEVLVSLVILSIGLLGVAKLMLFSSHANDSAYLRSQATALAYEILDNMRANKTEAIAHTYDTTFAAGPVAPGNLCEGLNVCTTSPQLALYDVYRWKQRLNATAGTGALPNGQGFVQTVLTAPQTAVTIKVQWDDSAAQSVFPLSGAAQQVVVLETLL